MNRFVHRHILLPAFESLFKRRSTLRYWRELERTQWLPRAEIDALQFESLRRLLAHAHEHCPFYREQWDRAGLHPRQLTSTADLTAWPVISRETIIEHRAAMRAMNQPKRLITKATGGSSGVPLQFDLDQDSHERRTAAAHRGYAWAHAAPGTKQLYLWGGAITARSRRAQLKDQLYYKLQRRRVVSCFELDDTLAATFADEIDRYRPDAVVAYTNAIYEVARQLEAQGRQTNHRPDAIVVGAEKLHDFQRKQIERVFHAPVFETYGSREFMLIGSECERHDGLHLTSEHLVVEILDDDGRPAADGTEGDVVITDLHNYGMPFIRYANGDRAVAGFSDCLCGRGLPLLKKVVGRRLDVLQATGGRSIPGEFFPHLVKDFPAIRRFQVIQDRPDRVRFALRAEGFAERDRIAFERLVRGAMGSDVRVDFEPVEQIALTAAGKLQVVVNQIPRRKAG
jgi:phenylacetate-CoA ligase